jgi:hypothetical protein
MADRIKGKHLIVLNRRLGFLEGLDAHGETNAYDRAEMAALRVAVAELTELFNCRQREDGNHD